MIARVAAVFSSSSDWKENVLQFAPDYSQQQNKNTASNQYVTYQAGKKETCSHNFARWRRGAVPPECRHWYNPSWQELQLEKDWAPGLALTTSNVHHAASLASALGKQLTRF